MTPRAETPLTAEELAGLRSALGSSSGADGPATTTIRRLLATLDAARSAPEPGEGLDEYRRGYLDGFRERRYGPAEEGQANPADLRERAVSEGSYTISKTKPAIIRETPFPDTTGI